MEFISVRLQYIFSQKGLYPNIFPGYSPFILIITVINVTFFKGCYGKNSFSLYVMKTVGI